VGQNLFERSHPELGTFHLHYKCHPSRITQQEDRSSLRDILSVDGAKPLLAELTTTFPDLKLTIEDILQDGDKVIVRAEMAGISLQRGAN